MNSVSGRGMRTSRETGDFEVEPPELPVADDEGHRLVRRAPADQGSEALGEAGRGRVAAVGDQPRAIPAEGMTRQHFRVDGRVLGHQAGADQRLPPVGDAFVDGRHRGSRVQGSTQWDTSDWKWVTAWSMSSPMSPSSAVVS
jgi:hypothetical protein